MSMRSLEIVFLALREFYVHVMIVVRYTRSIHCAPHLQPIECTFLFFALQKKLVHALTYLVLLFRTLFVSFHTNIYNIIFGRDEERERERERERGVRVFNYSQRHVDNT